MSIRYGGDYNPEQWDPSVWDEDTALMQEAGVTLVTLGVFAWARLEPREGEYEFGWLDTVMDRLFDAGIRVDLATATASPPPWLTNRYPEILPVDVDGRRLAPGSRQHYCPSSPIYRAASLRLVRELVERYSDHPAIELWHVNNEYGCHVARCYCDVSARAFRSWLRRRYVTIDVLNEAWGTAFWSQTYSTFDEILPPRSAPTWRNPAHLLDFDRFSSDELLANYRAEADVIRTAAPESVITTNFMGLFKAIDYWSWAPHISVVSDDSYPDPHDPNSAAESAMARDLMRSLKGGQPWMLMEQAASAVSWLPVNARKRPGQMRSTSFQAIARGADAIMFFQWRQSDRGAERFLTGMLPHSGVRSRVWREVVELGAELRSVALSERPLAARVAIVLDWASWWALEQPANPRDLKYLHEVREWHRALFDMGVLVDFIPVGAVPPGYEVVIAPTLFCATDASLRHLDAFVRGGGTLIATYLTGTTTEEARVRRNGYLGPLAETLGVVIEEFAPMASRRDARFDTTARIRSDEVGAGEARLWGETLHVAGAEVMASYEDGELVGEPAITRRDHGGGVAWYVATSIDRTMRQNILRRAGCVDTIAVRTPPDALVEYVQRGDVEYVINHDDRAVEVTMLGDEGEREVLVFEGFGVLLRHPK